MRDIYNLFLGIDLVTQSQYKIMRKITEHATAAALFYSYSRPSDESLRVFLLWLRYVFHVYNENLFLL